MTLSLAIEQISYVTDIIRNFTTNKFNPRRKQPSYERTKLCSIK